ncbi:MAG: GTP cyclohydrolase I FolE [Phycisphaerales bacterium]|jgi:GTP cyclohydrolase I|nr:GTP cyclohydrolase I FolE [Planctomycetota bacterium]
MITSSPCCHDDANLDEAEHDLATSPSGSRSAIDHGRLERAVREILIAVGENPDREGLQDTPRRVAKAYGEIFAGLSQCPSKHLARVFSQSTDEPVLVADIGFHSVCEHHLLPFHGRAHIVYLPSGGRVVGLSKLARTVEVFARRPQLQERLTEQIADALDQHLGCAGCAVMVEAEHLCMRMRGVRASEARMTTTARRGIYRSDSMLGREAIESLRAAASSR